MIKVGIVMGSDSDLEVMQQAAEVLREFNIEYEMRIISAHRTPQLAAEYASQAEERGLEVLIAGAGKAAHLAGVLAAWTVLPVIGIPVNSSTLGGADALYSMVQMPGGVPVATVALNGAKNAALLAVQIMGTADTELRTRFKTYKEQLAQESRDKDKRLVELGSEDYIKGKEEKGR